MTTSTTILQTIKDGNLDKAIKMLEDNVREESAKASGYRKSDAMIIKRMLKKMPKQCAHEFTYDGVTWYGFTDGHYAVACKNDMGYPHAEVPFDFNKLFLDVANKHNSSIEVDKEGVITFNNLHSKKDKTPIVVKKDDYFIAFNGRYLVDVMTWVNNGELFYEKKLSTSDNCLINPLMMASYDGDRMAIILPVHTKKVGA